LNLNIKIIILEIRNEYYFKKWKRCKGYKKNKKKKKKKKKEEKIKKKKKKKKKKMRSKIFCFSGQKIFYLRAMAH